MKELILIRGVSGCGKSTLAEIFENLRRWEHYETENVSTYNVFSTSADDYFTDISTGEYKFDASELTKAHEECQESVRQAMIEDIAECIVVHNTFTERWEMTPYMKYAFEYGYRVTTLIVENRHNSESIHNVPDEVIERQKERFDVKL